MSLALNVCALINRGLLSIILHSILVHVKHAGPLKSALLNSNPRTTWGTPPTLLLFLFALPCFCTVQCYLFCMFVQMLSSTVTVCIENSILFTFFHFMWATGKLETNYLTVQNRQLHL